MRRIVVNCVPDPVKVVREMRRVCKPGGKIVILNHFRSPNPFLSRLDRALSPLTVHIGFKSDLDLPGSWRRPSCGRFDREGQHPAVVVARDVRKRLKQRYTSLART